MVFQHYLSTYAAGIYVIQRVSIAGFIGGCQGEVVVDVGRVGGSVRFERPHRHVALAVTVTVDLYLTRLACNREPKSTHTSSSELDLFAAIINGPLAQFPGSFFESLIANSCP